MRKIIFLLILLVGKISFSQTIPTIDIRERNAKNLKIADAVDDQAFHIEYERFISTLERNLVFREKTVEFLARNATAEQSGESYQNWVLQIMRGAQNYLETRKEFLALASKYSVYQDLWGNKKYTLLVKKKMMIAVAASLQVYDNYFSLVNLASQNAYVRTLLNQGDATNNIPSGIISVISSEAKSWSTRSILAAQVQGFDSFARKLSQNDIDEQIHYLAGVIQSSPSYKIFRTGTINRMLSFAGIRINDGINELTDGAFSGVSETTNLISMGFGNSVGMIEMREGKLNPHLQPGLSKKIESNMKPLDMLLEKTPFRLTDRFIPGHWGHVAIWIGSKQQLQNEGLWDLITDENKQPAWRLMPLKKRNIIIQALSKGNVILEALRPGVQLNSLNHFMNIDDFLVIRPNYIQNSPERKAELIAQALTHFGKDYDFNFDVKTADKIVCSELAYWVFPDINWRTEFMLGRDSISPDNIINTVLNHRREFSAVMLYHNGKEVPDRGNAFRNELCSLQKHSTLQGTNEQRCR
ncbi:MAG: YiiX/YebB-like N1pC/P60 family cysteine hydrolase [Bdellovibrionota bacterium]